MEEKTIGFVGAGRVARIILGGLRKAGRMPGGIIAGDVNPEVLKKLQSDYPDVQIALNDNGKAASQDFVFLGLHPPAISGALADLKDCFKPDAILISLAPKLSIDKLSKASGGFNRIVRLIPNAASIIGNGYNPLVFSEALHQKEREEILRLISALGKCPEVAENKLESYAIVTAMGPTYFWFQWQELRSLAQSFGMNPEEAEAGVAEMATGAVRTLFGSGMKAEDVIDLIPVKPLGESEETIRSLYRSKLGPLYEKLKN